MKASNFRFIIVITICAAVIRGDGGRNDNNECGEHLTWTLNKGTLTISGTGDMSDFTSLNDPPWKNKWSSITSIVIEEGVTSIGNYAFSMQLLCESVIIPSSVKTIGAYAFCFSSSLAYVDIPNSLELIGAYAFYSCSSLLSVTIPVTVTSIGNKAFTDCRSLRSIDVEEGNPNYKSIDGVLFNHEGTVLLQYPVGVSNTSYTIPDGVVTVDDYSFSYCPAIRSVSFPDSVLSIGNNAFFYCKELHSVSISKNLETIGAVAFAYCSSLARFTVPKSVTSIDFMALLGCSELISIDVENRNMMYKSVDGVLFNNRLTTLIQYPLGNESTSYVIPDTVTSIEYGAFYGCGKLTSIGVGGGNRKFISIDGVLFNRQGTTLLQYPIGKTNTTYVVPHNVTSIEDDAFAFCSNINRVIIPDSVTSIGDDAFSYCNELNSVFYLGSKLVSSPEVFFESNELHSVCVPPDYPSDFFCDVDVNSESSLCKDFRSMFNHCYEASFVNGEFKPEKRENATRWEQQTNGCVEFQCINDIGGLSWSLCNDTNESTRVCVNDQCVEERNIPQDRIWTVVIDVNETNLEDVNIEVITTATSELSGVYEGDIIVGVECDEQGFVFRVVVYVNDEEKASKIKVAVESINNEAKAKCEYDILCKSKSVSIKVREMDSSSGRYRESVDDWVVDDCKSVHEAAVGAVVMLVILTALVL